MAFPTTSVLDNFNRADETLPSSANWGVGSLIVFDQGCTSSIDGIQACAWLTTTGGTVDEVHVATRSDYVDDSTVIYLFLRVQDQTNPIAQSYIAAFWPAPGGIGSPFVEIVKVNGPVEYLATVEIDWSAGDSLGFEAITVGDEALLNVYQNIGGGWSLVATYTDSDSPILTPGKIAIGLDTSDSIHAVIDNFSGGAIPLPPDAPTLLVAIPTSENEIDLTWQDNASNETGFSIERGSNGVDFTEIDTAAANAEAYNNTGLTSATLYYYRVRAYNADGNSAYSNIASATTYSAPTDPPEAPTLLTATPVSLSQINLAWTDNSLYETGFEVYRSLTGTGDWSLLTTTAAEAEAYSDTSAEQGITYYYRVRAINLAGNSAYSNIASAKIGDFMITEIANSLIAYMEADTDLSDVLLFIRGGTPFAVPQDHTPYSEVLIGEETPVDDLTGCVSTRTYRGLITFTALVQQDSNADWIAAVGSDTRLTYIRSYDLIKRLVMVAQTELQRYPSLGDLTTTVILSDQTIHEVVTAFRFDGSIVYGLDDRTGNYENFGSLPFIVETERTITNNISPDYMIDFSIASNSMYAGAIV